MRDPLAHHLPRTSPNIVSRTGIYVRSKFQSLRTRFVHLPRRQKFKVLAVCSALLFVLYLVFSRGADPNHLDGKRFRSKPYDNYSQQFEFALVADLDKRAHVIDLSRPTWQSFMQHGLLRKKSDGKFAVEWTNEEHLTSHHSELDRGMELSELIFFNKRLLAMDDRTGIVYEILNDYSVVPRHILVDGDGNTDKGFKSEWATVKDGILFIGSFGKESIDADQETDEVLGKGMMWIKTINKNDRMRHINWENNYNKLRKEVAGTLHPGYMVHEAVGWSDIMKKWVFLPRRVSDKPYREPADEQRAANIIITCDEDFSNVLVKKVGKLHPSRGFSSMKFLPGSDHRTIVALKSEENEASDHQSTFITVFDINGGVLLEETEIPGGRKYEGIEII